jgi:phage-related minor tail protein
MEKVPEPASGASSGTGPITDAEDTGFVPMYRLPPVERARNRAQMGRILDMLEEEERIEEERHQARDREQGREELEQRRANGKAEFERVKTAKDMQKKMGKALLKNMADARKKEDKEKERQEREDMEKEEARRSRKPRKSVSWAELPKLERSDDDAAVPNLPGKLPMRPYVVERFPARSGASSPPPPIPMGDSDDESEPPSSVPSDSDTPSRIPSDGIPFPTPEHDQSDGSEDEDEPLESHGSEDGLDIDSMQHQREIALAYFEKRNTIGADAARAMSAHSHDLDGDENDWEQEASHPLFPRCLGLGRELIGDT